MNDEFTYNTNQPDCEDSAPKKKVYSNQTLLSLNNGYHLLSRAILVSLVATAVFVVLSFIAAAALVSAQDKATVFLWFIILAIGALGVAVISTFINLIGLKKIKALNTDLSTAFTITIAQIVLAFVFGALSVVTYNSEASNAISAVSSIISAGLALAYIHFVCKGTERVLADTKGNQLLSVLPNLRIMWIIAEVLSVVANFSQGLVTIVSFVFTIVVYVKLMGFFSDIRDFFGRGIREEA